MSDKSDREDVAVSEHDESSEGEDSEESLTMDGNGFLDIEAEVSDGSDEDEDDDSNHGSDGSRHSSFHLFSELPPEVRLMIWEAVDPYLKAKGRVMEFIVLDNGKGDELWENVYLEPQTSPARTLLSVNRESRALALKHYPDIIQLRSGRGHIRYNSRYDILLLRPRHRLSPDVARWCPEVRHLALDAVFWPRHAALPDSFENLQRAFLCADERLDWLRFETKIMPHPFDLFWFENRPGSGGGETICNLFCWPKETETSAASFAEYLSAFEEALQPIPFKDGSIPVLGMVRFTSTRARYAYTQLGYTPELPVSWPQEDGEDCLDLSDSESYTDDYEIDGFVVDTSSEEGEDASDNEDDDDDDDVDRASDDAGDRGSQSPTNHEDLESFQGFSPLEPESPQDHISIASSPNEDQPVAAKNSSRCKRRIISSDGEDSGEDGAAPVADSRPRLKKRARIVLSDSEDDAPKHHGMGAHLPRHSQPLSSSDEEDDVADSSTDEDEEEGDSEEDSEPRARKPVSLLARLRQFRSDVPVSPEGDSPNSTGEEYGREVGYGDYDDDGMDGEGEILDAEYPDSAEEGMEDDEW